MCEFKLRVYLNDGVETKLIHREALNIKFEGDEISIFGNDGSTLKVKDAVITEVDAERQVVFLLKKI